MILLSLLNATSKLSDCSSLLSLSCTSLLNAVISIGHLYSLGYCNLLNDGASLIRAVLLNPCPPRDKCVGDINSNQALNMSLV